MEKRRQAVTDGGSGDDGHAGHGRGRTASSRKSHTASSLDAGNWTVLAYLAIVRVYRPGLLQLENLAADKTPTGIPHDPDTNDGPQRAVYPVV
ncbi:hypothetical protein [Xenorhabdus sp. SGI246]|uniref:hypothetical protein n=1 Tax=Xenorhabdus sp. SGI246 TaxID=3158263 RepID=UPI00349FB729